MKKSQPHLWIGGLFLGFILLVILLPIMASPSPPGDVLEYLPLGWWHFLRRNVSQITWNWSLIVTGIICSVVVVVLGNWLFQNLSNQIQQALHPGQPPQRWRWRWTICLYAGLWLLFAIAFGASGLLRHTTWLLNNREPWYQRRSNAYAELRSLDVDIRTMALDNDDDLAATRKAFYTQLSYRRRATSLSEEFDVIFYGDRSNKVAAYLMVPRNPELVARGKFCVSIPNGTNLVSDLIRPISELQKTIAELELKYPDPDAR